MHCERAREFFSDYTERALDRPMIAAVESHLAGCSACRAELESLQATYLALESLPAVEPPGDGAWQVIRQLRGLKAEERQARIRPAPTFGEWLRALSPASVAMGAGLATLVVAGTMMAPAVTPLIRNTFFPPAVHPIAVPHRIQGGRAPAVFVSYGPLMADGQQIQVEVVPAADLPAAHVQVTGMHLSLSPEGRGDIQRGKKASLLVNIPRGASAEVLRALVESPVTDKQYRYLLVVPLQRRTEETLTLSLVDQPLEEVLQQIVPYLGRPVVVGPVVMGEEPAAMTVQLNEASPLRCLGEVASRIHADIRPENGVYRLVGRQ